MLNPKKLLFVFTGLAIVVALLILIHIFTGQVTFYDFFHGNLLPEIAGFVLEGLVFVGLVSYFQKYQKYKELEKIKIGISQPLAFIIEAFSGNPFHWSKHVIHSKALREYEDQFFQYRDEFNLEKAIKINLLQKQAIIKSANEILLTYQHLTSLAFKLSPEHGMLWLSLTNSIKQIAGLYPYEPETVVYNSFKEDIGTEFGLNLSEFIEYLCSFYNLKIES